METLVLRIESDGTARRERVDQKSLNARMNGALTFVGAVDALNVFLVGSSDESSGLPPNESTSFIDERCYGAVYAIGSDARGEACDVDIPSLCTALQLNLHSDTSDDRTAAPDRR